MPTFNTTKQGCFKPSLMNYVNFCFLIASLYFQQLSYAHPLNFQFHKLPECIKEYLCGTMGIPVFSSQHQSTMLWRPVDGLQGESQVFMSLLILQHMSNFQCKSHCYIFYQRLCSNIKSTCPKHTKAKAQPVPTIPTAPTLPTA